MVNLKFAALKTNQQKMLIFRPLMRAGRQKSWEEIPVLFLPKLKK
jgi:hypothetical protein